MRRCACTATPPAGSSSRCGWIGCAAAAASRPATSAGWCSTARSSICTARPILRTPPTSAALIALARLRKLHVIRKPTPGGYGTSLHRDYSGEFDYNLDWKPLGGFPVTFGWINAIRRGQTRLHRGLDVGVPNLILRSDHSVPESPDPDAIQRGDAVLDVAQIARWSGCVGNHTTVAPITDAKHDVFLSLPEPRAAAYRELDGWLDRHWSFDGETLPTSTRSGQG